MSACCFHVFVSTLDSDTVSLVSLLHYNVFSDATRQNKECSVPYRIDNGTPAVLSARAHLIDVIFGDYSL